jgi:hypothetical protein
MSEVASYKVSIVRIGELDEIGVLCPKLRIMRGARLDRTAARDETYPRRRLCRYEGRRPQRVHSRREERPDPAHHVPGRDGAGHLYGDRDDIHAPCARRLAYVALIERAAPLAPPPNPALKDPKDFKLVGKVPPSDAHMWIALADPTHSISAHKAG